MLHTRSEEDSSAGRGVGRDFFQVLPENKGEYSPGLFLQEVRKEIPTFARKQSWGGLGVEGILLHSFYRKSRPDVPPRVGRTALAPSRNADSCHLFLQTSDNLGGLSSSISSKIKDGEGSLALSHNVEWLSEKTMGSFPT